MTSEIRTNSIKSRAGLSTVTLTDSGPMFIGITTFNDGKVSIGANNPAAKLEIKGSENPLVKIVQDTSGIARLNLESATNDGYQYSGIGLGDGTNDAELMWTTGGFDINVGNAVRLRINSNGAWGAGTNFGSAGQVLTSQGSGSPVQWATPSSFPSHIDIWRITSDMSLSGGDYLTSNWSRADQSGAAGQLTALKGAQVTQSSGVFTFPTTGIWQIMFQIEIYKNGACRWFEAGMIGTVDNFSSERVLATGYASLFSSGANTHSSARTSTFYKVSNVSNNKIKFRVNMAAGVTNESSSTTNNTWVEFVRVSDI